MTVRAAGLRLDWLGYATARIEAPDGTVVYTDPGRYGVLDGTWAEQHPEDAERGTHPSGPAYDRQDGDVVLVTHDHHFDDDGVRRVASEDATVVVYEGVSADGVAESSGRDVAEPADLPYDVRRVGYGDTLSIDVGDAGAAGADETPGGTGAVEVDVVPAYNEPEGARADAEGSVPHPRGLGCGYVWSVGGRRCFWTGDSDAVPEHEDHDVDVFLPTIEGTYTMDRREAAELAATLAPELVLPIHYDTFDSLRADGSAFAADVARRAVPVALDPTWPEDL